MTDVAGIGLELRRSSSPVGWRTLEMGIYTLTSKPPAPRGLGELKFGGRESGKAFGWLASGQALRAERLA